MKESAYKSYEDLPLFLNAELVAQVLGISLAGAYDLLHSEGFPRPEDRHPHGGS